MEIKKKFFKEKIFNECGKICSKRYLFHQYSYRKELYKKAKLKNIKYVPVVDKKGFLLGIHTIPNQYNNMIKLQW